MDAVSLLKKLIACRSITPADGGSLALIGDLFAAAGFSVQPLPSGEVNNLFVYKGDAPRLLFAGHVDVVPPGDLSQWESDPFTAAEKDGRIIGRGAADMKSGVAAMVTAALAQPADGVAVFLTSDEEGPARHGTRHFTEWWQAQGKEKIAYCIVGEPTCEAHFGDAIKIGRRGSLTCQVQIRGRQEHAAYAHRADNPAHRLAAALQPMIQQWQPNIAACGRGEMVTTFQVVELASGIGARNVTPPAATAVFNFRYAAPDNAESLQQQTAVLLDAAAAGCWTAEWEHSAAPYCLPADSRLVNTLHQVVHEQTGQSPAYTSGGGVSDGRFLRHICGELAEFGVVNSSIHAPNENVIAADVNRLADVYAAMIKHLL